MATDLQSETLITLNQATHAVPGKVHVSSLHRWRMRGVRGIKLETLLIGGTRFTSKEALWRFFEASTRAADGGDTSCKKGARRCQKKSKRACEVLDDAGIHSSQK